MAVAAFQGCVQACDGIGHRLLRDQTVLNIRERAGGRKPEPRPEREDGHLRIVGMAVFRKWGLGAP